MFWCCLYMSILPTFVRTSRPPTIITTKFTDTYKCYQALMRQCDEFTSQYTTSIDCSSHDNKSIKVLVDWTESQTNPWRFRHCKSINLESYRFKWRRVLQVLFHFPSAENQSAVSWFVGHMAEIKGIKYHRRAHVKKMLSFKLFHGLLKQA